LLEAGAEIHDGKDRALRRALWNGHTQIAQFLIDSGASLKASNDDMTWKCDEIANEEGV